MPHSQNDVWITTNHLFEGESRVLHDSIGSGIDATGQFDQFVQVTPAANHNETPNGAWRTTNHKQHLRLGSSIRAPGILMDFVVDGLNQPLASFRHSDLLGDNLDRSINARNTIRIKSNDVDASSLAESRHDIRLAVVNENEVRVERENQFNVWCLKASDFRLAFGGLRVIAIERVANDLITRAEGKKNFRNTWSGGHDPMRCERE